MRPRALRASTEPTYKIIRFRFKGDNELICTGLTLDEAQEYCNDPRTRGPGWFDGYTREDS